MNDEKTESAGLAALIELTKGSKFEGMFEKTAKEYYTTELARAEPVSENEAFRSFILTYFREDESYPVLLHSAWNAAKDYFTKEKQNEK